MGDSMSTIINATTTNGVVIQPDNSGSLELQTNSGTTALTISTAQNATFAAQATIPTINLTGGQIVFPATQSASADANTLDDYEEGTWTPNQGSGLTVVGTFSSTGVYTKIGKLVTITARYIGSTSIAAFGSGNVLSTNAPFTCPLPCVGSVTNDSQSAAQGVIIGTTVLYLTGSNIAATPIIYATVAYYV
jgi:hypothetical protein